MPKLLFFLAVAASLLITSLCFKPAVVKATPHARVCILAHGLGEGGDTMTAIYNYLLTNDLCDPFVLDFATNDNIINAQAIQEVKTVALSLNPGATVHLIGASMGGLSTRYCIKAIAGCQDSLESYISLDTPQYGAYVFCGLSYDEGGQMCPGSAFLNTLNNGDDTPGGVRYYQLLRFGSLWNDALDGGVSCTSKVYGTTHIGLMSNPTTLSRIRSNILGNCP